MATDQRCGTCRWAELDEEDPDLILCRAPRPICDRYKSRLPMFHHDGEHCPCYQPAPQTETEECPDAD